MLNLAHIHDDLSSLIGCLEMDGEDADARASIVDQLQAIQSQLDDAAWRAESWAKLREPFVAGMIGKLPRVTCGACREANTKVCGKHSKSECRVCHNWITSAHMHLDYVGHAAVTDRINSVDPEWTWRPIRWTDEGQPAFDRNGGLWIEITILDVTRPAYGDAEGKRGADAVKAAVSDAIKNGAMRYGIGLDLWSKEDLLAVNPAVEPEPARPAAPAPSRPAAGADVDWLALIPTITDLEVLITKGKECDQAGEFKGRVKSAFVARRKQLEKPDNGPDLTLIAGGAAS